MKTTFQLFLIRWHHASNRPLPAWLRQACDRDPRLAAKRNQEERLTSALRNTARADVTIVSPSPYLAVRIQRSIKAAAGEHPASSSKPWFLAIGAVAAAGLALVTGLWTLHERNAPGHDPESVSPASVDLAASGAPAAERLDPNRDRIPESARSDLITSAVVNTTSVVIGSDSSPWTNPLRQELDNVVVDAQGALRFLASNFLPSSSLRSPQPKPQPAG